MPSFFQKLCSVGGHSCSITLVTRLMQPVLIAFSPEQKMHKSWFLQGRLALWDVTCNFTRSSEHANRNQRALSTRPGSTKEHPKRASRFTRVPFRRSEVTCVGHLPPRNGDRQPVGFGFHRKHLDVLWVCAMSHEPVRAIYSPRSPNRDRQPVGFVVSVGRLYWD